MSIHGLNVQICAVQFYAVNTARNTRSKITRPSCPEIRSPLFRGPSCAATLLVWEIVNTGTKPIILAHLGVSHFDGREGALGPSGPLPRPIQPGEKTEEYSTDLGILNDNLKSLWVQDTVGKTYRFPRRLLKKLIAGPREATKLMVV